MENSISETADYLILRLLFCLGVREGELLSLKFHDVNFRTGRVFIPKRPDDEDDQRGTQAKSKTRAPELPLTNELIQLILDYVENVRP